MVARRRPLVMMLPTDSLRDFASPCAIRAASSGAPPSHAPSLVGDAVLITPQSFRLAHLQPHSLRHRYAPGHTFHVRGVCDRVGGRRFLGGGLGRHPKEDGEALGHGLRPAGHRVGALVGAAAGRRGAGIVSSGALTRPEAAAVDGLGSGWGSRGSKACVAGNQRSLPCVIRGETPAQRASAAPPRKRGTS